MKEENLFTKITDKVSFGMGTPANIIFWIFAVLAWFCYGIFFIPGWFTSNAWNFPLNTITTLAEFYIGFLIGAAANRNERTAKRQQEQINEIIKHTSETVDRFSAIEDKQFEIEKQILEMETKILAKIAE